MTSSTGFISDHAGNNDIETIPPSSSIIYNIVRRKSSGVSSENDDNIRDEELKKQPHQTNRKSGLFGTSANLVNTIVGAGIIGIPYAFKQSGLIVGLLLLGFVGYLTDKSLRIMIDMAAFHPKLKGHNVKTFERLASIPFGPVGRSFILINMFVMAYGAMVAYLLIIKDTVPTLIFNIIGDSHAGFERELVLVGTSIVIILPLSMFRDMSSLSFTSTLSVAADIVLVIFILIYSPVTETVGNVGGIAQVIENDSVKPGLFIGLGVLSTAMACQHSAFIISDSLHQLTRHRWNIVTVCSISMATALCAILGTAGYLGFMEETQGDVLNNFDAESVVANVARGLLAFTMFFTYPMEAFVARHVLFSLLDGKTDLEGDDDDTEASNGTAVCCMWSRRHLITLAIYISTLLPALLVDDLGPVLSITGAIGASSISYIAPGLIYLGINGEAFVLYCHKFFGNSTRNDNGNDNIELPVVGDSSQKISDSDRINNSGCSPPELPIAGEVRVFCSLEYEVGVKPWWWWILGFPIWYGIAFKGMRGVQKYLSDTPEQPCFQLQNDSSMDLATAESNILPSPEGWDFFMAVVFVIFGVVALAAGLTANIMHIVM